MEKILAVDIGNSFTKLGCFVDGVLDGTEGFPTEKDDFSILEEELQEAFPEGCFNGQIHGVVVSSVVPSVRPLFERILGTQIDARQILWLEREQMEQLSYGPVDFSKYEKHELGTDRIANIVGGQHSFPEKKVIVCDFGTTTTYDLVEESGQYIGGAITPGPKKFQSLVESRHAAQLYEVDVFEQPSNTPGLSTRDSLANGLYYGYKGTILEILGNLFQQAQWPLSQVNIIFTGGYASQVRSMVTLEIPNVHIDQQLTLSGLYRIWQLNQPSYSSISSANRQ